MMNPDLSYYGLFLANIETERYEAQSAVIPPAVKLTLKSSATAITPKVDQFTSDMEVMNKVRASCDPAVKDAYEQLLTVMALTSGRVSVTGTVSTKKK